MPKIKIDHVISFSSEDPVHVANNILSGDPAKKWKCKESGERSATLVLQFEKASVISAIDIGNQHSAYIEVLVARSGSTDDYKVLLVMSSFMTPLEARQSTNVNKVRMFTQDQLSKPESEQKWDRVKVVCTQPFNRHVQYGLSFIAFHTPAEKVNGAPVQTTIGKFVLRPESGDDLSTGSLFARRTEIQKESLSAAAAIREASSSASPVSKPKLKINTTTKVKNNDDRNEPEKPQPRNRNEILYSKDEEEPNEKIDKIIEKKKKEVKEKEEFEIKQLETQLAKEKKQKEEKKKAKENKQGESSKRKQESDRKDSPKKKPKLDIRQRKPFFELLKGVTLVISGIQNPDRGNLRTMALAMGAKYKADWDNTCTHLVCAFPNTPKFNQVKGKGKIVKRNWIEECHSQRKRLPWRRFCLDKSDSKQPESEDEIWEEEKIAKIEDSDTNSGDEGFDDTKMQKRIDELQTKQREKEKKDTFSEDTDEEILQPQTKNTALDNLPDFLDFKTFFIDETLDEDITKTLERYVIAYKGIIAENPSEEVDIFITTEDNADNLRSYNSAALCLRPDWLWDCHNSQKFVSTNDYIL